MVNEGLIDRLLRVVVAVAIVVAFLMGKLPGYRALLLMFSGSLLMSIRQG